jgi:hypothetical protein
MEAMERIAKLWLENSSSMNFVCSPHETSLETSLLRSGRLICSSSVTRLSPAKTLKE